MTQINRAFDGILFPTFNRGLITLSEGYIEIIFKKILIDKW